MPLARRLLRRRWIQGDLRPPEHEGDLEGEKADEVILWYSHPGITTRSVEDTSILLRILAEPQHRDDLDRSERQASEKKVLRVGVAENAKPDAQVGVAFAAAVDAVRTAAGNSHGDVRYPDVPDTSEPSVRCSPDLAVEQVENLQPELGERG